MEKLDRIPTLSDINMSHEAIRSMIHRTPILHSEAIDRMMGAKVLFKCENFQKVGAFKMRGATSAALRLTDEERNRGLATHSSGNHAQAVAKTAQLLGIPAYIVMPENAPSIKQAATKDYGAEIVLCEPTLEARESTLEKVVERTGATFLHPYDNYNVIAGQATAAKEVLEDTKEVLDYILTPIGGGGLACGTGLTVNFMSPDTKVIGTEPEVVDDAYRSFKSGKMAYNTRIDTIADGLRTNLCEKTFQIIHQYLEDVFTVSEASIVEAMRIVWERMKIVIEASSAVPLAALLENKDYFENKKVAIIITGGNVDLKKLPF